MMGKFQLSQKQHFVDFISDTMVELGEDVKRPLGLAPTNTREFYCNLWKGPVWCS